jgi:hypothetical protein
MERAEPTRIEIIESGAVLLAAGPGSFQKEFASFAPSTNPPSARFAGASPVFRSMI